MYLTRLLAGEEASIPDISPEALNDYNFSSPAAGCFQFEPKSDETGFDLVISCGIHGNETAPIEICDALLENLCNGSQSILNRLLLIFGNLPAIRAGERFLDENMNRLFDGTHECKNHPEAQRAGELEAIMASFYQTAPAGRHRIHLDLHTAIRDSQHQRFAIYPYQDKSRPLPEYAVNMLKEANISAVLLGHKPSTTFSYHSAKHHDALSFTVELGKVRPFGANPTEDFKGIRDVLKDLLREQVSYWEVDRLQDASLEQFEVVDELIRHYDDFELNLPENLANFSILDKGAQITMDGDKSYIVKEADRAIVFPNAKIPIGQRAGLIISKK